VVGDAPGVEASSSSRLIQWPEGHRSQTARQTDRLAACWLGLLGELGAGAQSTGEEARGLRYKRRQNVREEAVGGKGRGGQRGRRCGSELGKGPGCDLPGIVAGRYRGQVDGDVKVAGGVAADDLLDGARAAVVQVGDGDLAGCVHGADRIIVVNMSLGLGGIALAVGAEGHPDVFDAEHAVGLPGKGEQGKWMPAGEGGDIVPGAVAEQHLLAFEQELVFARPIVVEIPGGEVEDDEAGPGVVFEVATESHVASDGKAAEGVGEDDGADAELGVDKTRIDAGGRARVAKDDDVGVLMIGMEAEVQDGGPPASAPAIEAEGGDHGERKHGDVDESRDQEEQEEEATEGTQAAGLGRLSGGVLFLDHVV